MATLSSLVNRIANRLSMVSGTGVQIYAEDRIAEMIQHKFDVMFSEVFWPQFLTWETITLDGTLGVATANFTNSIKRFEDIRVVFIPNSNTALTKLSALTTNPLALAGTTPIHYEALGPGATNKIQKVFNVWPKTSTGTLDIQYRTKPDTFVPTDEIDFDDQALILGATFDYLEDDGTNPNATQKFQLLFEARVKQLKNEFNSAPISLDPVSSINQQFTFTSL
tara:strand:- start:543 stop:1211 length:669 start_codon:yes stop_codon:yes gene_type:complete